MRLLGTFQALVRPNDFVWRCLYARAFMSSCKQNSFANAFFITQTTMCIITLEQLTNHARSIYLSYIPKQSSNFCTHISRVASLGAIPGSVTVASDCRSGLGVGILAATVSSQQVQDAILSMYKHDTSWTLTESMKLENLPQQLTPWKVHNWNI